MKAKHSITAVQRIDEQTTEFSAALLDVSQVAQILGCSMRHVYRLADGGRMPRPVKLGALVRWSRDSILDWIARGCPPCRTKRRS